VPWFAGSNIVAAISGVRRMSAVRLGILLTIGIAGRLALYWWIGKAFDSELDRVLSWLDRYQWPLTIVSIALVVVTITLNVRRGRSFKM